MRVFEKNRHMETVQLNGLCLEFRAIDTENERKEENPAKVQKTSRNQMGKPGI